MCGRFTRKENIQQLAKLLGVHEIPQLSPRYNIAPSQLIACVRANPESQKNECVQLTWGLIPSWAKEPGIGQKMINARAETVAEKPAFRRAFQQQRCLIVADGFYEWKREGKVKQPYYIRFADNRLFAIAGVWERWENGHDALLDSCAMITTEPNALMAPIYHRMPVILPPQEYALWLDPATHQSRPLTNLLQSYPSDEMEANPISAFVNNPRNDTPLCIQTVDSSSG